MDEEFARSVEEGLKLAKRVYTGKNGPVPPPKPQPPMKKSDENYLPTAPMVYAVISNPAIVDNPDIPSYQPHVFGKCDPPALIPLQMNEIEMEAEVYLDTVFVRVSGSWTVHCIMRNKSCDCRIAIPMGEQGSILGVEVELPMASCCTRLIAMEDINNMEKDTRPENGASPRPHIFTVTIPKVDGGCTFQVKLNWMQKLLFHRGEFQLFIPFSFPEYVTPVMKLPRKEKMQLIVNSVTGNEISFMSASHPLKEVNYGAGKMGYFSESEVLTWSNSDFYVSYRVSSSNVCGSVLLRRDMFSICLLPGDNQNVKMFRKCIVFVVDISGSMGGRPLESTRNALCSTLNMFDSDDLFNIIAFNGETFQFSSAMESATEEIIQKAHSWINANFVAGGSTNILLSLNQAVKLVLNSGDLVPVIFLVTDGTVENEKEICSQMKSHMRDMGSICPRIYTFGIGSYCNHHFLQMLAIISNGQYSAALHVDLIESQMQKLLSRATSIFLANLTLNALDVDNIEPYSRLIPDLSTESPLVICGRFKDHFPSSLRVIGVSGDSTNFTIDVKKLQMETSYPPLDLICAEQQINVLTAWAWFSDDKELEEKVAKISLQAGIASEYTQMVLCESERGNHVEESLSMHNMPEKRGSQAQRRRGRRRVLLESQSVGFGNLSATEENIPSAIQEPKLPEAAGLIFKATSNCCSKICATCGCMCCISCCNSISNECAVTLTQICTALACLGCLECCSQLCCGDGGH